MSQRTALIFGTSRQLQSVSFSNHPVLFRLVDVVVGSADCSQAIKALGWKASTHVADVVKKMY